MDSTPSVGSAEEVSESEAEFDELEPESPALEFVVLEASRTSILNVVLRSKPFPSEVTTIVTSQVLVECALEGAILNTISSGSFPSTFVG